MGDAVLLVLHIALFFWAKLAAASSSSGAPSLAKPNCTTHCGETEIPYPFGIEEGCYDSPLGFQIICNTSFSPPKLFLNKTSLYLAVEVEVLEISLLDGTLKVPYPIAFSNCTNKPENRTTANFDESDFRYSEKNRFTAVSCGRVALMKAYGTSTIGGCLSICAPATSKESQKNTCGGVNCCQSTISRGSVYYFNISFGEKLLEAPRENGCNYAFLADQDWFESHSANISAIADMDYVPVLLEWDLYRHKEFEVYENGTYSWHDHNRSTHCTNETCVCSDGFRGNPYLINGCQDINECEDGIKRCDAGTCINYPGWYYCQLSEPRPFRPAILGIIVTSSVVGLLFLLIGAWWLHKAMKKRKNIRRKEKFFKQNGGLLLKQQLSSGEVNIEKIILFNSKELEKATDSFNADRILGQGGFGTVYKGMLTDGRIVAVKKSKIGDGGEGEVGQFINEIVILSQIMHRNVVKLLGCCLETEVPLLVYEFIPNGTLSHYIIHHHNEEFPLTWEMRLRISIEVAGALSYLHSAASVPIYHRDIKSCNILLDDKYRAKVADFGTSRLVDVDKTHLTMTQVQGTFGYLDPEYFQSSQFTDKSDVYSYGVVLAELLTGQKPVSLARSQEGKNLTTYFLASMEESRLFDILDARVKEEGGKEEIMTVASLAKRCLNMKGKKRPTMKEVAAELEGIRLIRVKACGDVQQDFREVDEHSRNEISEAWDVGSTSTTGPYMDSGSTSSQFDAQPLLSFKSQ